MNLAERAKCKTTFWWYVTAFLIFVVLIMTVFIVVLATGVFPVQNKTNRFADLKYTHSLRAPDEHSFVTINTVFSRHGNVMAWTDSMHINIARWNEETHQIQHQSHEIITYPEQDIIQHIVLDTTGHQLAVSYVHDQYVEGIHLYVFAHNHWKRIQTLKPTQIEFAVGLTFDTNDNLVVVSRNPASLSTYQYKQSWKLTQKLDLQHLKPSLTFGNKLQNQTNHIMVTDPHGSEGMGVIHILQQQGVSSYQWTQTLHNPTPHAAMSTQCHLSPDGKRIFASCGTQTSIILHFRRIRTQFAWLETLSLDYPPQQVSSNMHYFAVTVPHQIIVYTFHEHTGYLILPQTLVQSDSDSFGSCLFIRPELPLTLFTCDLQHDEFGGFLVYQNKNQSQ